MITFIPLEFYHIFFYSFLLFFVLLVYVQSLSVSLTANQNIAQKSFLGYFLIVFTVFYIGLRPISFAFADMAVYAQDFEGYKLGMELQTNRDLFFEMFMRFCAQIMPANAFFLLCCFLYVLPMYFFSKKQFGEFWFYGFFMLLLSFSFWAYGTNGIRNGIATSFFLIGISRNNRVYVGIWMLLAVLIHQSLIVPVLAYIVVQFYSNTRILLAGWFIAIPLSLALGTFWQNFFMSIGIVDEARVVGYLSGSEIYLDNVVEIKTGFRWDFLLYSASGVFAGWYFIVKKQFEDEFYRKLFSIYLIANALWILVIRANFSNRIAYLSWFLLGAVIIYPLLKNKIFTKQHQLVGGIIAVYFLFTYVTNVFLAK